MDREHPAKEFTFQNLKEYMILNSTDITDENTVNFKFTFNHLVILFVPKYYVKLDSVNL